MIERCTNTNCLKTHCARHKGNNIAGAGKDYNTNNTFKCNGYVPLYDKRKGGNPSVVAEIENGRVVRKLKWNY